MKPTESNYRWFTPYLSLVICLLFYVHVYFLRMSITGIGDFLTKSFHVNAVSLSLVAATYYYAYAIVQIPAGLMVDRFSPKRIVGCASLLVTLGAFSCWYAKDTSELFLARILMGLGGSFAFLSILKIASTYFKRESFPLINGITFAIGTTASILAGAPLLSLLQIVAWKKLALYLTIAGVFITILAFSYLPSANNKQLKEPISAENIFAVLKIKNVWFVALFGGMSFSFITIFAGLWLMSFLKVLHPNNTELAGYSNTIMLLGFGIGALILGKISQSVSRLKPILVGCSIGILCSFIAVLYLSFNLYLHFILVFLLGFFVSSTTLSFTLVGKLVDLKISGFAFSFVNIFQILIGSLMLPLSGYLLKIANLNHLLIKHSFDAVDFRLAMTTLTISAVIAILSACLIKE